MPGDVPLMVQKIEGAIAILRDAKVHGDLAIYSVDGRTLKILATRNAATPVQHVHQRDPGGRLEITTLLVIEAGHLRVNVHGIPHSATLDDVRALVHP